MRSLAATLALLVVLVVAFAPPAPAPSAGDGEATLLALGPAAPAAGERFRERAADAPTHHPAEAVAVRAPVAAALASVTRAPVSLGELARWILRHATTDSIP